MGPPQFKRAPAPPGSPPRPAPLYQWSVDSEFLLTCLADNVGAYFAQVLGPRAAAHHARRLTGRLMTDKEVVEASVELTTSIIAELGGDYASHLHRYFGDDEGMVAYVLTRVRNLLLEKAVAFNDDFITTASRREAVTRLAAASETPERTTT